MKRFLGILLIVFAFVIVGCSNDKVGKDGYYKETNIKYVSNQSDEAKIKNIILIIGDGMGENHVKITSEFKAKTPLDILKAEYRGMMDTNCLDNYVTDSAASATAMATGVRTLYERVGMDADGNELKTFLDYAHEKGLSTGLLTTDNLFGATPSGFSGHTTNRYLDEKIIINQQISSDIDILMGYGEAYYYEYSKKITNNGWEYVNDRDTVNEAKTDKIFAAFSTSSKKQEFMPTLAEMTKKSIEVLSKNEKGFVLVVEEAYIDKEIGNGDIDAMMNRVIDLDKALRVALNFMRSNDETLVIVLADHETGGLVIKEGTPDVSWITEPDKYHTNVKVPVYAFGTRSKMFDNCDILNSDIFDIIMESLELK